jgi:hypothetical protein
MGMIIKVWCLWPQHALPWVCLLSRAWVFVCVQVEVFWVVMAYSVAIVYQCFRGPCCIHIWCEVLCVFHHSLSFFSL